jgi:ketosteroid isomerase-like protein
MIRFKRASMVALGIIALSACTKGASSAADSTSTVATGAAPDAAADEQAIRAVSASWWKAYNAHDVDGVVALYADDAVENPPGVLAARGSPAIRDLFQKDIQAMTAAGYTNTPGPNGEFGASGDLGWEWNTYTLTDKSGATIDKGKYVTVFARRNGKWMIIRDIFNSDTPPAPAK